MLMLTPARASLAASHLVTPQRPWLTARNGEVIVNPFWPLSLSVGQKEWHVNNVHNITQMMSPESPEERDSEEWQRFLQRGLVTRGKGKTGLQIRNQRINNDDRDREIEIADELRWRRNVLDQSSPTIALAARQLPIQHEQLQREMQERQRERIKREAKLVKYIARQVISGAAQWSKRLRKRA